jgi:hypothetical protein
MPSRGHALALAAAIEPALFVETRLDTDRDGRRDRGTAALGF